MEENNMTREEILSHVDHTLLKPQQTQVLFSHTRARTLYMHVRVFSLLPLFF